MSEELLKKVIGKLMQQVEEERRLRIEAIQALVSLPVLEPFSVKVPSSEEIERRIQELS
jgi:hypothetical protein